MSTQSASVPAGSPIAKLGCLYCSFKQYMAKLASPFLLVVRLYWGWLFAQTGWGKLHNLGHVHDYFMSLGIPAPGFTALAIASLEFFGGILLILGLATRLTGLLLACNMFVAYVTADREALKSIFSAPDKFYQADPFTFMFAAIIAVVFGAGFFSLDYVLSRPRKR